MKRSSLTALAMIVAGVALFAGGRSILADSTPPAGVSIVGSPHDLHVSMGINTTTDWGTNQVCMPCHTPHGMPAANAAENLGKLWNHAVNQASAYTLYNGTTSSTSYLTTIDETSRKCLGCHDGTIAVDSFGKNATQTGGTMIDSAFVIGAGKNLQHDHPIDVLYNSTSNYTAVSNAPGTLNNTTSAYTYTATWSGRNNDPSTFTVDGYYSSKWNLGVQQKYSVVALSAVSFYSPSSATQTVSVKDTNSVGATSTTPDSGGKFTHNVSVKAAGYVYCRSCHDPHNHLYSFMRVPNDNSQLCLTCHNK